MVASAIPCLRARSAVFVPASCSFNTAIICSSVNLARFICPSFFRPDSNSIWRKYAGAGHVERKMRNFLGHKFWARGYFVTTVGRDEEMIRAYIRNQELADRQLDQFELKISAAPNPINRPNIP